MSRKTTASLIVFGVLLALVLLVKLLPEQREEIAWSIPKLSDTLDRVEIVRKGATVVMEKKGDTWVITQPKLYELNSTAFEGVLQLFEKPIGMDLKVPVKAEELARFDLTGDNAITLKLGAGGKELAAFVVGKTVGTRTFVKPLAEDVAYRAKASLRWKLDKELDDWREKKLLPLEREQITGLRLQGPAETVELSKTGDTWRISQPAELAADGSTVTALLSALASARAAAFADDVPADKLGFGPQSYRITVTYQAKAAEGAAPAAAPAPITLEFGGLAGKDLLEGKYEEDTFVRREGGTQVFVLRSYTVKSVQKRLSELRDRTLLTLQRDSITGMTLVSPARTVVLERKGEEWDASAPAELVGKLDPSQANSLLSTVSNLRAQEVAPAGSDPAALGLSAEAPASGKVDIRLADGTVRSLLLGKKLPEGPPQYYARMADGQEIYIVNDYTAQKLLKPVSGLRRVEGAPAGGMMPPGMMPGMMPPGMMPPGMMPPGGSPE